MCGSILTASHLISNQWNDDRLLLLNDELRGRDDPNEPQEKSLKPPPLELCNRFSLRLRKSSFCLVHDR